MLPLDFIDSIERQMGDELDLFCRAMQAPATTSVRLNDKLVIPDFIGKKVPWCDNAYYLDNRPKFTLDPLLHAGCYYVQDASSMFIDYILKKYVSKQSVVLDLCAAPGGKSTLISQYLGNDGLLVSNEIVRQRVFILSENIQKWGNGNTVVTHNKPSDFSERCTNFFDCILVDAPCSGEGMFRKDAKAIDEWSEKNVELCISRQRSILMDSWDALRPGGILIYSTCAFNTHENEDNANFIKNTLHADILPLDIPKEWGITETIGYHFYPHKVKGEGFYVCVFRKKDAPFATKKLKSDKLKRTVATECEDTLRSWILQPELWTLRQEDRFSIAYPIKFKELIDYFSTCLTCISTGFGVGEMRGKIPAPQHSLSMSKQIRKEEFVNIEIDKETALKYLRCEALPFENQPIGYLLLTYMSQPLGFVKNIGGHSNNMYPKEWRIRNL